MYLCKLSFYSRASGHASNDHLIETFSQCPTEIDKGSTNTSSKRKKPNSIEPGDAYISESIRCENDRLWYDHERHEQVKKQEFDRIALEREKLEMDLEKLEMEREKLVMEKETLGLEREKLWIEHETANVKRQIAIVDLRRRNLDYYRQLRDYVDIVERELPEKVGK